MDKFIFSLIGIFVAMDIFGALPIYFGITQSMHPGRRRTILTQSILVAAGVALTFVFIGTGIFKVLGISMFDFKIGGGIVLMVMAILELVRPRCEDDCLSTGVVPLAVPLITGPALLTTVMLQVGLYGYGILLASLVVNFVFAYLVLLKSDTVSLWLGKGGADIVSKIAALLMTAIAVSLIRTGIVDSLKM